MAITGTRHDQILAYLKEHDSCGVKELASALYVSDATIRRDLTEMQNLGLIKRNHGGAVLMEQADETSIFIRMAQNAKQKELIATKALPHLTAPFTTVFLDSSSTALALAQRMNLKGKTVVTNGIMTAQSLSRRDINLIMTGGNLSQTGTSLVGSLTSRTLSEMKFDLALFSCAAIDGREAYESSLEQREIKRTVFERSKTRVLLADASKLTQSGAYFLSPLEQFDLVVFDCLSDEQRATLSGVNYLV